MSVGSILDGIVASIYKVESLHTNELLQYLYMALAQAVVSLRLRTFDVFRRRTPGLIEKREHAIGYAARPSILRTIFVHSKAVDEGNIFNAIRVKGILNFLGILECEEVVDP